MIGIIHCTPHCNMACRYCFEENWKNSDVNTDKINEQFLEATDMFIEFAVDLCYGFPNERVDIILHGGEPLLIDIDAIERFFSYTSAVCDNIRFIIQSNGTILSNKHIEVFKQYNVYIGFSIDGPENVHDYFRVDKNGRGTHKKVMENYQKIKEAGIHIGALVTFNGKNNKNIKELYRFFADNNIDFTFNPFFEPSKEDYSIIEFNQTEYAQAICDLFDLWITDNETNISIRNFESIIDGLTNKEKSTYVCSGIPDCSNEFVAIDLEGNIYPCNHFCENKTNAYAHFKDGNICNIIGNNNPFKNRWDILKKGKCGSCDISDLCHGGCPYHALIDNQDINTPDTFCNSNKIIVHHIYDYLKTNLTKK